VDPIALVDEQIKAGQKLVERLNTAEVPVAAAAWIKEAEGEKWYLYLVTSLVGEDGAKKPAYRRITPFISQLQGEGFWIDPFEVKVIGPTHPVAQAILAVQRQSPGGRLATRYGGASLGGLSVEGAYLYPLPADASR
jgi:hypothetical protein